MIALAIIWNVAKWMVKIGVLCMVSRFVIMKCAKAVQFLLKVCVIPLLNDVKAIKEAIKPTEKKEEENQPNRVWGTIE